MTNLYILPIEPLEERYTAEWYKHFPTEFAKSFDRVTTIDGVQSTLTIETGSFLDMNSTIHYKAAQMQRVSELFRTKAIEPGDVFFVSDIEFWGIESIRLLSQINKVPVRIYGFLHAASYTLEDAFAVAAPYQKYTELGWLAACDGIFVGSEYHKQAVYKRRILQYAAPGDREALLNRIHAVGNPLFFDAHPHLLTSGKIDLNKALVKTNKLVITNRFDYEKRPNDSLVVAYMLKRRMPEVEIVVTTGRAEFRSNQQWLVDMARDMESDGIITIKSGLNKEQYHAELASAKVMLSNSIEENFGYCIVEAMMYRCAPLLLRGASHPELVGNRDDYLFDNVGEAVDKAAALLGGGMLPADTWSTVLGRLSGAVAAMSLIMLSK